MTVLTGNWKTWWQLGIAVGALINLSSFSLADEWSADQLAFFEQRVRPLLSDHCFECHSHTAIKVQAGCYLDSRAGMLAGGDSGPTIEPGSIEKSLLIEAIRYESYEMPPQGKLSPAQIGVFERWIAMGAPWPDEEAPQGGKRPDEFDLEQRASEHWVWRPLGNPAVPIIDGVDWPEQTLDRFILEKLEASGLAPAPTADRSVLLRRLYFDLTGLPPTPEQSTAFMASSDPLAWEKLVDQLLASPHFGERWGRHWLDLVRYAESRGHEFDNDAENAYQYRDYIIRALNADVAYDQLIREHLAGDLLDNPRLHPSRGFNESILGTGFWFLGEWVHSPVDIRKDESDRFDNMIDVMSKAFLGVTVACARCHDHKFDAISTADYYALSGFLQSSDYRQVRFESLGQNRIVAAKLAAVDDKYRDAIADMLESSSLPNQLGANLQANIVVDFGDALVVDYGQVTPPATLQDGFIFGSRPRRAGEPLLCEKDGCYGLTMETLAAAASDSFWNGLESITEQGVHRKSKLSALPRSGRTLRTPTFTLTDGHVDCRVEGRGSVVACVDSHRLVAGPLHGETIVKIQADQPWVRLDLQRYIGHRLHLEFNPDEGESLRVALVLQGASPELKRNVALREHGARQRAQVRADLAECLLGEPDSAGSQLRALVQDWGEAREALRSEVVWKSRLAMAMMDGTGEDDHLLIRGSSANPGAMVPRRFLTAVTGAQVITPEVGSGRLQLAEALNAPANPLTSRVIVNRIWHHLMGRGIVPTTDDLGVLGQRPTHPELLDFLAQQFRAEGQSIKSMIRAIVLSSTYQMSDRYSSPALQLDPDNLLWHYRPPKRLEGEIVRDSLLAISGELNARMYGEPVPIHLTNFMDGRGKPGTSGPLDGDSRRTIYVAVRRNFLSPFLLAFDAPVPFSCMGRRNVSNVPAQSLILMNDPLVVQLCDAWSSRTASQLTDSVDGAQILASQLTEIIHEMILTAFARKPTAAEIDALGQYAAERAQALHVTLDNAMVWKDLAHALVNAKEFIYLR